MKLFELQKILPKNITKPVFSYWKSKAPYAARSTLENTLKKLGWTPPTFNSYDSGANSMVFANPKKSFVIKINKFPDKGYARFVEVIHEHPNKHFPKISAMKSLKMGKCIYYVYLIEKLKPIKNSNKYADEIEQVINYYTGSLEEIFRFSKIPKFLSANPNLVKAARLVGKYGKNDIDMHEGNIMQRTDGTIVIIDPYC